MNQLNSILIEGTITDDPQNTLGENGIPKCSFTVASCCDVKEGEAGGCRIRVRHTTIKVPCETQGRTAEVCGEYLKKGRGVRVVGRLAYAADATDKVNGEARLYISVEHVEFKPQIGKKAEKEPAGASA